MSHRGRWRTNRQATRSRELGSERRRVNASGEWCSRACRGWAEWWSGRLARAYGRCRGVGRRGSRTGASSRIACGVCGGRDGRAWSRVSPRRRRARPFVRGADDTPELRKNRLAGTRLGETLSAGRQIVSSVRNQVDLPRASRCGGTVAVADSSADQTGTDLVPVGKAAGRRQLEGGASDLEGVQGFGRRRSSM